MNWIFDIFDIALLYNLPLCPHDYIQVRFCA